MKRLLRLQTELVFEITGLSSGNFHFNIFGSSAKRFPLNQVSILPMYCTFTIWFLLALKKYFSGSFPQFGLMIC
jgi:hypothetical protein